MRTVALAVLSLTAVGGCDLEIGDGDSGIAVGNPPGMARIAVTIAPGDGVSFTRLHLPVAAVYTETCDGQATVRDVDPGTVLGIGETLEFEAGRYCALGLVPTDRPTEVMGVAGAGTFSFMSGLGRILLFGDGRTLDADATLVLELAEPGWIAETDFGLAPDEHLELGQDCLRDPLCERLRSGLMDRGGLYDDPDGDGTIDDTERDAGTDTVGDDRRD